MDGSFIGALRGLIAATPALSPTGTLSISIVERRAVRPHAAAMATAGRLLRRLTEGDAWQEAAAGTGGAVG